MVISRNLDSSGPVDGGAFAGISSASVEGGSSSSPPKEGSFKVEELSEIPTEEDFVGYRLWIEGL
jgi:hypothetical protein